MKKIIDKMIRGTLIGLCSVVLVLCLWLPGVLDGFEWATWDLRARVLADPGAASDEIVVILLDQGSLDWGEEENYWSWPWPRVVFGVLAQFCERAGAKALAYDVVYTEHSAYQVEDDMQFVDALHQYGNAIGAIVVNNNNGETSWPLDYSDLLFSVTYQDEWVKKNTSNNQSTNVSFSHIVFPIPELLSGFAYLANVQQNADPDGIYREARLFSLFDNKVIPGLPLATFLAAQQKDSDITLSDKGLTINAITYPLNNKNNVILRFRGSSGTHTTYTAKNIIQSELMMWEKRDPVVNPGELKDKYVLFGYSAPGLLDLRPSPVDGNSPGVEIHATVLDNMLTNDFIQDVPQILTILVLCILAILIGILGSFFTDALRSVIIYIIVLSLPVGIGFLGYVLGFRLPIIAPFIAFIFTLVGVSIFNFATEGQQKRFIKNAFKQYLSPAVIDQLISDPDKLRLGGERKELSIFFSDLQGFTSISEALTPEKLTSLLNDYLTAMTDIILEQGGTVDKYEGDAIIAFWNAPITHDDHALRAVRAALRCQEKLAEMRPAFRARVGKDMLMRIGLNTGQAVVGNMGSHDRFDYTMLGDAVNLASRLEGINKQFNSYTMISQATKNKIGDAFPVRELSRVAVVGRKEPVTVYEPMFAKEYEKMRDIFKVFARGLESYYKGNFATAKEIFLTIIDKDPVARAYSKKCDELLAHPPRDWLGVWVMTTK